MSELTPITTEQAGRSVTPKDARQRAADEGLSPGYSINETADILGIGVVKLYAERNAKRLRVCNIGARSIVFADDLKAYKALLQSEADARPQKANDAA